ncbi:MAG TPA: haloalkane dehalogenase [Actinomycetota bacterium]
MQILRTPDERFQNLPGFAYVPNYLQAGELRIHYVDEGPADAPPVLMLHGEPSWAYLYRKMIPVFTAVGLRAVAPDLVGFGRSDKPAERGDYTYERHVAWMLAVIEHLDLREITLVCQDWGGLIGLRLAAEHPDRFARIVAANTFLPTGDTNLGEAFHRWHEYSQTTPDFNVGNIVNGGCVTDLHPEIVAAYDAPFPSAEFKAGARQFPTLVPASPDDPAAAANRAAWGVLSKWEKPLLTAFSDQDPITRGADRFLQAAIPGAAGRPHATIEGAGHFLQEDKGEELARVTIEFVQSC